MTALHGHRPASSLARALRRLAPPLVAVPSVLAAVCAPLAAAALLAVGSGCGEPKPSIAEALASDPKAEFEKSQYVPTEKKARPSMGPPPPTDAELAAWDRKDPEGEKHLYKWDKANFDKMMGYWEDLECFRLKVKEAGDAGFGKEPGTPEEEKWHQFKQMYVPHVNAWQQRLFANEPRVLEKSKFMGPYLEAHELVMKHYPQSYNDADKKAVEETDTRFDIVRLKLQKYSKNLDKEFPVYSPEDDKAWAKHLKRCDEVMIPPKSEPKVRKGKKSPI
jgi:hypothetical protein